MSGVEDGAAGETTASPLAGALEGVKRQRAELKAKGRLELLIPGYKGNWRVVYRDLSDAEHDQLSKRVDRAQEREDIEGVRQASADILVRYCDRIQVREPGDEEFLTIEAGHGPVRFGKELADLLDIDSDTAAGVVLEVFSPKGEDGRRTHPDAVQTHMEAILAWRQGRESEISRELLGN